MSNTALVMAMLDSRAIPLLRSTVSGRRKAMQRTRPEHLAATGLSINETGIFLDGLAALVLPVRPHFLWRPQLRDPNDEMVLEAAVNGHADAIVTFNRRDFLPAADCFGIDVERPGDILRRLK